MAIFRVDKKTDGLVSLIELSVEVYLKYQKIGLDTRPIDVEVNSAIYRMLMQEEEYTDQKEDKLFKMLCTAEKRYFDSIPRHMNQRYDA